MGAVLGDFYGHECLLCEEGKEMAYFTKRYHPPGTDPGLLVSTKPELLKPLHIHVIDYDETNWIEKTNISADECKEYLATSAVTWIHVSGEVEPEVLRQLGAMFDLHPLALEDVLNTGQRPKAEVYDDQLFVIMSSPRQNGQAIKFHQTSLFCGENFLVSFCPGEDEIFEPIRKRLRNHGGKLRARKVDYLLYAVIDLVIDQGFPLLEYFGGWIENIEDELLDAPDKHTLNKIHELKRDLLLLRRMLWPHRDVINALLREEHALIGGETKIYLKDCYDHTIHIMDLLETYRDMSASMLDVYLSSISHRLNEIMRILTVIATIFIPMTFAVGVYGMNFDRSISPWNMPELGWYYGYPLVWAVMIAGVVVMLGFFRYKKWL